ncbi:transposase [Zavarzinia compransoris]|uniref:transposase n=1 Tax=Zavarzinia compransoris TaxID=1264899 RepID=UPI003C7A7A9A
MEAEAGAESPAEPASGSKSRPHRRPLPPHLPREDVVHTPACTCTACDGPMACLGEDVTEVLDYVPGHFKVIRHVRPKYICPTCSRITQMPAPALPTPRGLASAGAHGSGDRQC